MLNNIKLSRYIKTESFIDKMNATSKLITLILFLIISTISSDLYFHILLLIFIILLVILSKISLFEYIKSVKIINYFLIGIFIINLIFKEEIVFIIINILKILELVVYTSLITLTTSEKELINGLNNLLKPLNIFKIKTNRIAFILSWSIRFIPVVIEEMNKIIKSLSSRGIEFKKVKIKNKILILKIVIIPIINLSLKKSDEVAEMLDLRLYDIDKERTKYEYNKWTYKDTLVQILFILLLFLVR